MNEIHYSVEPLRNIAENTLTAWHQLRDANPALYSPYFHPDYARHVAQLVEGCKVVIKRRDGAISALLPFQGSHSMRPIGAPMTDYHGVICAAEEPATMPEMIKAAGGSRYRSDAWVGSAADFCRTKHEAGSMIDFGQLGGAEWVAAQGKSFRKHRSDIMRRRKHAVEEFGPMRVVYNSLSPADLALLIKWKTEQFEQQGLYNVLGVQWTAALLRNLLLDAANSPLRLDLHTLSFGERVAAIDTGLSDGQTYHRWIIAYDPELRQYSPGSQMLTALIDGEGAPTYRRIDHGIGNAGYKSHYSTHPVEVQQGLATASSLTGAIARGFEAIEHSTHDRYGDWPGRIRRRYSQIASCEQRLVPTLKHMGRSSLQILAGTRGRG